MPSLLDVFIHQFSKNLTSSMNPKLLIRLQSVLRLALIVSLTWALFTTKVSAFDAAGPKTYHHLSRQSLSSASQDGTSSDERQMVTSSKILTTLSGFVPKRVMVIVAELSILFGHDVENAVLRLFKYYEVLNVKEKLFKSRPFVMWFNAVKRGCNGDAEMAAKLTFEGVVNKLGIHRKDVQVPLALAGIDKDSRKYALLYEKLLIDAWVDNVSHIKDLEGVSELLRIHGPRDSSVMIHLLNKIQQKFSNSGVDEVIKLATKEKSFSEALKLRLQNLSLTVKQDTLPDVILEMSSSGELPLEDLLLHRNFQAWDNEYSMRNVNFGFVMMNLLRWMTEHDKDFASVLAELEMMGELNASHLKVIKALEDDHKSASIRN
ncbi:hypothetical protein Plhal304r1_c051g0134491 [Plasmopara halstedii]